MISWSVRLHFGLYIILISSYTNAAEKGRSLSADNCIVWGPGLDSRTVVPVRFFYIQAVDDTGTNLTTSVGKAPFNIAMNEKNAKNSVRVYSQILDRNDGTYLVRYKLYETYKDLEISLQLADSGLAIAKSPYLLKGYIYHEACYCPVTNIEKWAKTLKCKKPYRQIEEDLSIFKAIDMDQVAQEAVNRFNQRGAHSLCHYVVLNNKIYRKTYGEHVGFKMFTDAMLLSITRKVKLPDIEFFVNLGDWPLVQKNKQRKDKNPLPIFSWCGSDDTLDIVMPTYDVTESTLETLGRVSLDLMSVQGNTGPKWNEKINKAIWRGRDSRQERLDLVKMSRKKPHLIDAALTNMFFFPKNDEEYGPIQKHISFFDFFKYKYQINIDGTVAAYRLPYLLAGDAVVLKQDSPYYEHFYKDLKPMVHYIPFRRDLSDLEKQLKWTMDNQDKARKIALQGQEYIRNNMMADEIFCYQVILFKEYAKQLTKPVRVREGMELVEQPNDHESQCKCPRLKKSKKSTNETTKNKSNKEKDEL